MNLNRSCPTCHSQETITIQKSRLVCSKDGCSFDETYACPICGRDLDDQAYEADEKGHFCHCGYCNSKIHTLKIKNLIETGMIVDPEIRCELCQAPTVHHPTMNLAHRCFFYPSCSGQSDLFETTKESFTFLDFETTGLEVGKNHIIEVGALKIDEEGYEYTYQTFVKPPVNIPAPITKITGIDDEMVADAPEISHVLKELCEFIGTSTVVAHNADFDVPWLMTGAKQHEIALDASKVICTLKWAKQLQEPRCSLGALSKKYHLAHENAHRALADAAVTKELFFIFENTKSQRYEVSIEQYEPFCNQVLKKYRVPA